MKTNIFYLSEISELMLISDGFKILELLDVVITVALPVAIVVKSFVELLLDAEFDWLRMLDMIWSVISLLPISVWRRKLGK